MKVNEIHRLEIEEGEDFNFRFDHSPNVSAKPQLPQRTLIVHAPVSASVIGAASGFKAKPKKGFLGRSIHLILGKDGKEIVQMVPFHVGAVHALGYNGRSIGIQLQYPGQLLEKGFPLQLKSSFNENEYILASALGGSHYTYWPLYPKAQLDSLLTIARALKETYEITDVVAYDEILNATHPGPAFPIIQFREQLLGVNDRSILLQETARTVSLLGQPGMESTLLSETRIPRRTPVSVINEKENWYLISVVEKEMVGGNPWLVGWVEKSAVRVNTSFVPVVRDDHYLATQDGRRFQEITPHQNGYEPSRRNPAPKYVIMHFTTGTKMESTISHFKDPSSGVSTHLLIGRDGRVVQFLPFDRIAYHSGFSWWERQSNLNNLSIGIELDNAGLLSKGKDGSWVARKIPIPTGNVEQAVHWKQFTPNDPNRFPGWEKFPDVQLRVALKIVKALIKKYQIEEILGHDDVNILNRYDPGPLFPMKKWRHELFHREEPDIEIFTINQVTDLFSNFNGRLPNLDQRSHEALLPTDSVVKVIRQDDHLALVTVVKTKESRLRGATGWVRANSLGPARGGMKKPRKKKNENVVEMRTTKGRQPLFRRGKNPPTPKLAEGPFKPGTRVRIQQIRGEWTLVLVLDTVKGRGGLEGWIETELLSPEVIP